MTRQSCNWCREITGTPTLVGIIETGSGPGRFVYACQNCRAAHGIAPLAEHAPDSDGRPQYLGPGNSPPTSPS
jgi:hypothetical protein